MRPPRLARWLLARTVGQAERTDVIVNLDELFLRRVRDRGRFSAYLWYWSQAATFGPRTRWHRPSHRFNPHKGNEIVHQFLEDIRFAARSFRKSPAFTVAATLTLALGIGANALIFTVVYDAVLRPLPYPNAEELVWLWPNDDLPLTHRQFVSLQRASTSAQLSAVAGRAYAITGGDVAEEVTGYAVSPNHFDVFGMPVVLGRGFRDEDGYPGAEPVAVLSNELWRSHFGADSTIIGRRVDLYTAAAIPMISGAFTGSQHTVVGVTPSEYRPFGSVADVYTPLVADPDNPSYSDLAGLSVIGRTTGTDPTVLEARLLQLIETLPEFQRVTEEFTQGSISSLRDVIVGPVRPAMLATFGAVGLVLLIACANVANLVLVRTQARQSELVIRHALGATRGRVARQLLTESLVLSTLATTLGLLSAYAAMPIVQNVIPHHVADVSVGALRAPIVTFSAGLLIVTTLVCGLVPSIRSSRHGQLRTAEATRRRYATRSTHLLNRGLAIVEIAVALTLAYGAGLLLTSFARLHATDVGFNASNVMTMRIAPSDQKYGDVDVRRQLVQRIVQQVRVLPGVTNAGAIHFLPIADGGPGINFLTDASDPESRQAASYRVITPGYLEAMNIPVLSGRSLGFEDQGGTAAVGLINRALANTLWPDQDPIGRTLYRWDGRVFFTVVGVVGNVRQSAIQLPPEPEIYIPLTQTAWASSVTVVARIAQARPDLENSLRAIVRSEDASVPITRVAWMDDLVRQSVDSPRFYTLLFSLFAILALVLGAIGVYAVASFITGQRSNEVGIRMALGASARQILRSELRNGVVLAASGVALGAVTTLLVSRALSGLLYEVSTSEPLLLLGASLLLGGIAVAGAYLPARRAARNDPVTVLR